MVMSMQKLFQGKYRIPSARAEFWDYSQEGSYFVTICTKNRVRYFGEVRNGIVVLSDIGKIVQEEWLRTPTIRPDMNVCLGEFIIMPDHLHSLLNVGNNQFNYVAGIDGKMQSNIQGYTNSRTPGPQCKNLASIIRGFKSAVTARVQHLSAAFSWQPNYHERIIRDDRAYVAISQYIKNNPANWKK